MPIARRGFRRLHAAQDGAQGRVAQRLADRTVAPECSTTLSGVLCSAQLLDNVRPRSQSRASRRAS